MEDFFDIVEKIKLYELQKSGAIEICDRCNSFYKSTTDKLLEEAYCRTLFTHRRCSKCDDKGYIDWVDNILK